MSDNGTELTVYFGERARVDGQFLADALSAIYERHRVRASVVMRAMEGFGPAAGLRTDRLLTLSEDLPLVSVAADTPARIDAVRADIDRLDFAGLMTLEDARLLDGAAETGPPSAAKLTVYVGRGERAAGRPAYQAVVDLLHARGVAGATVLLGVDGTRHGVRTRARFFGRNREVPLLVMAVGNRRRIAGVMDDLDGMLQRPLMTLAPVEVLKRDGRTIDAPRSSGGGWQKLSVFAGEQSRHEDEPLHEAVVRRLREQGAAGATSLRGIWGFHGDHRPHGDSFRQLRRHVPVMTVVIDRADRSHRWLELIDELTDETGLVIREAVPSVEVLPPPG